MSMFNKWLCCKEIGQIAYLISQNSDVPVHERSLVRAFTAGIHKAWVKIREQAKHMASNATR